MLLPIFRGGFGLLEFTAPTLQLQLRLIHGLSLPTYCPLALLSFLLQLPRS